jgi:hypothetical protein
MKTLPILFFVALFICSCSTSSTKYHDVTVVTYDTISTSQNDCPVIRLFFTTGFENNQLIVNWNNAIIYNGKITSDQIKGVALRSVTVPKNQGRINVQIDGVSIDKNIGTDYCNLVYRKSGDSLFLEFTNKELKFD